MWIVCRIVFIAAVPLICLIDLAARAAPSVKRARPPSFSKSVRGAFFPDAREKLVGSRPQPKAEPTSPPADSREPPSDSDRAPNGRTWSKLITSEAIEDEIKSQQRKLAQSLKNPATFKGGGYKQARVHLSVLAALFAIDAQYDQPMRWQREAAGLRELMAKAGFNCKVGTDASYREARQLAEDLESLVRGNSIATKPASRDVSWPNVAERSLLMKRLEEAQEQALSPWTANPAEFARRADALSHEAQLVAALAEVIRGDGYEFADDETYREYAALLQTHALAVRDAVAQGDHEQARRSVGEVGKACTSCHEGYRN